MKKVIWITGASSGIGEELAYQYSKKDTHLILSARRREELEKVKSNCKVPDQILVLPLDLSDQSNFKDLAKQVIETFGRIDILINNGGISQRSSVQETNLEIDKKIMEVNFFGNIALTKAVLPYMIKQQSGHIVPLSSLAGKFGFYLRSAYAASKHALHGFYETLRLEEQKNNINVTIVCPAFIQTNISKNALDANGKKTDEMDVNQANGMTSKKCASEIIKAIEKNKHEALIGNGEERGILLKRFFPKLFFKILSKKEPK